MKKEAILIPAKAHKKLAIAYLINEYDHDSKYDFFTLHPDIVTNMPEEYQTINDNADNSNTVLWSLTTNDFFTVQKENVISTFVDLEDQ
tara:strand:- start:348 stop:614 length:267 start_codon:yes stop_codon:yes gene_type:complete